MKILDQNFQLSSQTQSYQYQSLTQGKQQFVGGQLVAEQGQHKMSQSSRVESHSVHSSGRDASDNLWQKHSELGDRHQRNIASVSLPEGKQSSDFPASWNRFLSPTLQTTQVKSQDAPAMPEHLLQMVEVIENLMERMTGKPYRLQIYGFERADQEAGLAQNSSELMGKKIQSEQENLTLLADEKGRHPEQTAMSQATGERHYREILYQESESMRLAAKGQVSTQDGRTIEFAFASSVSREFMTQAHYEKTQGLVATDPLVINFDGQVAQLTVDKFEFDLDSDGSKESMAFLHPGSGFLALDKNENGKVDNGGELFGPTSGNGFTDLRAYDDDQNGWIDENDAVFAQLRVWHQTPDGFAQLDGLLDLNIGAIALQSVESAFTYKDQQNQAQAEIKSSSIFLKESGGVGSIQQIDLVV